jgi:hypothetical protein
LVYDLTPRFRKLAKDLVRQTQTLPPMQYASHHGWNGKKRVWSEDELRKDTRYIKGNGKITYRDAYLANRLVNVWKLQNTVDQLLSENKEMNRKKEELYNKVKLIKENIKMLSQLRWYAQNLIRLNNKEKKHRNRSRALGRR